MQVKIALGAKADILNDNLLTGMKIKNNAHFSHYLTKLINECNYIFR